jgi:hypothetical protein
MRKRKLSTSDKPRNRTRMDRFHCHGQLLLRIDHDDMSRVELQYSHEGDHTHYTKMGIEPFAIKHIHENKRKSPSELYAQIKAEYVKRNIPADFTQPQVYNEWKEANQGVWQLDPDELVSAGLVLDSHREEDIERLQFPPLPPFRAYRITGSRLHECCKQGTAWYTSWEWTQPVSYLVRSMIPSLTYSDTQGKPINWVSR